MIQKEEIKAFARSKGAVKCGIATIDRFKNAPKGFHPLDIYPKAKSVVVYLLKMPDDTVFATNPIPYTITASLLYSELDRLGLELCRFLENNGKNAVLIPADTPYMSWNTEKMHGQGILSLRHAAFNAGLGILGRNTLLITSEFGNMVYIGAVVTDCEIEPDELIEDFTCPPNCKICLDACPQKALDGITVNQKLCRQISFFRNERGFEIYDCNKCRKTCVLRNGKKKDAFPLFRC